LRERAVKDFYFIDLAGKSVTAAAISRANPKM
jgi:hypothetical protein